MEGNFIGIDPTGRGAGVEIFFPSLGTRANKVQNNYIETDRFGTGALANGFGGVFVVDSSGNTIGGAAGRRRRT